MPTDVAHLTDFLTCLRCSPLFSLSLLQIPLAPSSPPRTRPVNKSLTGTPRSMGIELPGTSPLLRRHPKLSQPSPRC
ncbi:hypothetical protein K458DRAFT_420598 [Lentithecium fluviatile CBS 122367]|uniref:Uncharacterized protein n=1 Tax=Lentithecium fluviatile CBS 122367 TaxID=1168545 RepID=A0A6G1ITD6_9PLEO|nr:hypothetical protein K458DRAFT_420598 [Lentithecium fluviatile CBS 122367]